MVKVLIYALLFTIALAGGISTGAEAQDYVVYTFRCPDGMNMARTDYDRKIGSDPSFSLENNTNLRLQFRHSGRIGQSQTVYCNYTLTIDGVKKSVNYEYAVKRKILSCMRSGSAVFTCNLKP